MNDAMLMIRARRAYERGRIVHATRRALLVVPFALLPIFECISLGRGALMLSVIAAAIAAIGAFHWRGGDYARGANVGAIAGMSPLLLPLVSSWLVPVCSTLICGLLPAASIAGGFVGALCLLGGGFTSGERPRAEFWSGALIVTATLGLAGCLPIGLAGLAGMATGFAAGTLPLAVRLKGH